MSGRSVFLRTYNIKWKSAIRSNKSSYSEKNARGKELYTKYKPNGNNTGLKYKTRIDKEGNSKRFNYARINGIFTKWMAKNTTWIYLYYNWPGTVRVPAPCQYAHKLAYLVGLAVKRTVDEKLCNKLFFM